MRVPEAARYLNCSKTTVKLLLKTPGLIRKEIKYDTMARKEYFELNENDLRSLLLLKVEGVTWELIRSYARETFERKS